MNSLFDTIENIDYSDLINEDNLEQNAEDIMIEDVILEDENNDNQNNDEEIIIEDIDISNSEEVSAVNEIEDINSNQEYYESIIQYQYDILNSIKDINIKCESINLFMIIIGLYIISSYIFKLLKIRKKGDL